MKAVLKVFILCMIFQVAGPSASEAKDDKYSLNPTENQETGKGVYIPKDLEDSFVELGRMLHPKLIEEMKAGSKDDMSLYHHSFGRWMRNNWGLWKGSRLSKYFNSLEIHHPDDMTGIILDSYWDRLHGQPIDLEGQIRFYKKYWEETLRQDREEKKRVQEVKKTIKGQMLHWKTVEHSTAPLKLPKMDMKQMRARYLDNTSRGPLVKIRTYSNPSGIYRIACYMVENMKIRPLKVAGLSEVKDCIALDHKLYALGTEEQKLKLVEVTSVGTSTIPLPETEGWIRLGKSDKGILIVTEYSVAHRNQGRWNTVLQTSYSLPKTIVPPRLVSGRIYFRDEGRSESDKALQWVDLEHIQKAW